MTLKQEDWIEINNLQGEALKIRVFEILQYLSLRISSASTDDPELLDSVPRLTSIINDSPELASFKQALGALARASGLWNYIDRETSDIRDRIVAETVTVPELDGITLHREQVAALNVLLDGQNLILSAPTSFGKSLLIDALIATGKYQRIAIVLPTIALLDEFRRRLRKRFSSQYELVMHADEEASSAPTIFLGTQERLLHRKDLGTIDLTVVDEFYKLDPYRQDERSITLNAAVYKLLSRSRQFFFLGPNIDGLVFSDTGRWKFEFLKTRFQTVAVNTFDMTGVPNKEERLIEEAGEERNWPCLIFVSSPDKANKLAQTLGETMAASDDSSSFADWLRANVGNSWPLIESIENGFAVHHGRIPRAIASQTIRMFNKRQIPVLICTSTLIEGVNTAAKTVLIYDKKIARSDYDFFTYSNIRGRAGRLGQHHVGQVYLFNDPPEKTEMEVEPTLFGEIDDAPDDYVVHLEPDDTNEDVSDRIVLLRENLGLDLDELRVASSVGLDTALIIKQEVEKALKRNLDLVWNRLPDYNQIKGLVDVLCRVKRPTEFGAWSAKQLPYFISSLSRSKTMKQFLLDYHEGYKGKDRGQDNIFKFLRACEYGLPQHFSLINIFVSKLYDNVDYSLFTYSMSTWFRPEILKNLDEEGIPIQISERFYQANDTRTTLLHRLTDASLASTSDLTEFERQWVIDATN